MDASMKSDEQFDNECNKEVEIAQEEGEEAEIHFHSDKDCDDHRENENRSEEVEIREKENDEADMYEQGEGCNNRDYNRIQTEDDNSNHNMNYENDQNLKNNDENQVESMLEDSKILKKNASAVGTNTTESTENAKDSKSTTPSIPSPFKSILFWPEGSSNKKSTTGRLKEKIPSVCSSSEWKEYYVKKEKDKMDKEKAIQERKRKREERKQQLQENKLKNVTKRLCKSTPEESVKKNIVSHEKGAAGSVNTKQTVGPKDISVNDYVIVRYLGENFPGRVTKVSNYGKYFVSAMTKSGLNYWKWPSEPDELWYLAEDVCRKINIPTPINNRGVFSITEMEN